MTATLTKQAEGDIATISINSSGVKHEDMKEKNPVAPMSPHIHFQILLPMDKHDSVESNASDHDLLEPPLLMCQ